MKMGDSVRRGVGAYPFLPMRPVAGGYVRAEALPFSPPEDVEPGSDKGEFDQGESANSGQRARCALDIVQQAL